jgi:hypothetical protein
LAAGWEARALCASTRHLARLAQCCRAATCGVERSGIGRDRPTPLGVGVLDLAVVAVLLLVGVPAGIFLCAKIVHVLDRRRRR